MLQLFRYVQDVATDSGMFRMLQLVQVCSGCFNWFRYVQDVATGSFSMSNTKSMKHFYPGSTEWIQITSNQWIQHFGYHKS